MQPATEIGGGRIFFREDNLTKMLQKMKCLSCTMQQNDSVKWKEERTTLPIRCACVHVRARMCACVCVCVYSSAEVLCECNPGDRDVLGQLWWKVCVCDGGEKFSKETWGHIVKGRECQLKECVELTLDNGKWSSD